MEKEGVDEPEEYLGKKVYPKEVEGTPVNAYILATFDGDSEDQIMDIIEQASDIVTENGALDVLVADTPKLLADAWQVRSALLDAIEANTDLLDECDVVVPINKIPDFLHYAKSLEQDYGFKIKSFGHAGDGNLHIYTCSNADNKMEEDEFKAQVEDFMKKVYAKATEFGGLISGEHGIGYGKIEYLKDFVGPVNMRLMEGIKEVFDPNMILNPGKVCYQL